MLPRLKQLVDEVAPLHSKLILLIGPPGCGKTALLSGLAGQVHVSAMNLGLELGTRLSKLLFEASLAINPLDLLKRLAHARRVVAAWPGEHRQGSGAPRLTYAETSHPEHRDYSLDGVVPFYIQT
jgi:energy-coupling factor transporter ATP-binding protein EcfA2